MTERRKIYILSGAIILICVLILSLNFFLSYIDSKKSKSDNNKEDFGQNVENVQDHDPFSNLSEISTFDLTESSNVKASKNVSDLSIKNDTATINENLDSTTNIRNDDVVDLKNCPFKIPEARNDATLYFIFDDAGQNVENLSRYMELPFPFAVSILPGVPKTLECADLVREKNKELMLHQPMQAENLELNPGPCAISAIMNTKEIVQLVSKNLELIGKDVKGVNNHEGSLITSNIVKIGAVLEVCKAKKIYFLDSRTTAQSKAVQAGIELDTKVLVRSAPFLDNEVERERILQRIYESLDYANTHEKAIIIGHVDKSVNILPELLKEMYPYLLLSGYKFNVPSSIK